MADYRTVKKANICFDCEKACGGCPWSAIDRVGGGVKFELPEGCVAEPVYDSRVPGKLITYHISECPLFEQTPKREVQSYLMLDDKQNEEFMKDPMDFIKNFIPRLREQRKARLY